MKVLNTPPEPTTPTSDFATEPSGEHYASLSERVMVWLDLASNSGSAPKLKSAKPRASTAKVYQKQKDSDEGRRVRELSRAIVEDIETKEGDRPSSQRGDLGEVITNARKPAAVKRELHIFLPKLPKRVNSDVSSVVSSKCSSVLKTG